MLVTRDSKVDTALVLIKHLTCKMLVTQTDHFKLHKTNRPFLLLSDNAEFTKNHRKIYVFTIYKG